MASLPTLPRASWLRRALIAITSASLVLSALTLCGWVFHVPGLLQPRATLVPMNPLSAAGFLLAGGSLLAVILGFRAGAWGAVATLTLGIFSLLQLMGITPAYLLDLLMLDGAVPGAWDESARQVAAPVIFTLLIMAAVIAWQGMPGASQRRTVGLALGGSVVMSVGAATLLGYALNLPAVYRWGTSASTPPVAAVCMLLLGVAVLMFAWLENRTHTTAPPTWLPLPVVVGSATLTLILWVGLRERELAYLGTNTQIQINSLASAINQEMERQANAIERMARRWSQAEATPVVWEVDAATQLADAAACQSVSLIDPDRRTQWLHPVSGNEYLLGLRHADDPVRNAAIEAARSSGAPSVSGTVNIPGIGPGFVIYTPLYRGGDLHGYVAGEFVYRRLLSELDQRLKIGGAYHCTITVGSDVVYDSPGLRGVARSGNALESVLTMFNRRVRVRLVPAEDFLRRNRRFLPELALAAGFGITTLLGLSVHLARTAYTSLRTAELSNQRLQAENEERRRVEAMLKVSDERLRLALDSTQIGIFEWNLSSNQLYYSPGLWTMLGYQPGQIAGTPEAWAALIHPEDLFTYRAGVQQQLAGEALFVAPEYRVRTGAGDWRWLYSRSKVVTRNAAGTPVRIIGTLQDISERKAAEEALRESQSTTRKLSLVAARTDNMVIIGNPTGTIEWVNESFIRVMEYSLEEVVGRNPAAFMVGPDTNPRTVRRIRAGMARGEGISTDVVNYSKSGRKYHLHLEIQPVRNEAGQLETFIAILADITARVETETALRRAKAEADAASRAKSEFLASMSHEIRTPMNGVIGMTSLLLETNLDLEQRDFVNTIRTSGEALLTIINDILDFSKIESGKMELEHVPFDLAMCIEEALDLFSVPAAAKKLEPGYCIEPDVPAWIVGDVTRLRQVIVNLVNNAVKFTPSGNIDIVVRRRHSTAASDLELASGQMLLEFAIRDTGIGIAADRVDRLFKPFSQVDSSTTRRFGGTGLGLAICHRLCALMGGSIRVDSTVGRGSSFVFTIRTEPGQPQGESPLQLLPEKIRGARVLCLDDNAVIRRRLATFFEAAGVDFFDAATVPEALKLLDRSAPFRLALADVALLGTADGAILQARIDALSIPTVLLLPPGQTTAHAFTDRRNLATAAKPLKTLTLVRALQSLLQPHLPASNGSTPPIEARTLAEDIPLDVLLVEDNAVNQKVALRFLDRLGYRADAVANGLEAVTASEGRHYQLILMDLQMPEMDGFEASRQIRRRLPAGRQPRIVALTANALQGDRELCIAAGMDDYITKPVKLHELGEVIRRQFTPRRSPANPSHS
ncbi:MAG TPA: response regulator [Opitutaceae bacterium]